MYTFYTELDVEECKKRINEIVRRNKFSIGKLRGKIRISNDKFYLVKTRSNYVNSFSRIFYGKFIGKENVTVIQGDFHIHILVKIFMTMWFCGLSFGGTALIFATISDVFWNTSYIIDGNAIVGIIVILIMFIFGVVLVKSGVWFGKDEEKYVLEFIKTTLKSKEL